MKLYSISFTFKCGHLKYGSVNMNNLWLDSADFSLLELQSMHKLCRVTPRWNANTTSLRHKSSNLWMQNNVTVNIHEHHGPHYISNGDCAAQGTFFATRFHIFDPILTNEQTNINNIINNDQLGLITEPICCTRDRLVSYTTVSLLIIP